MTHVIYREGVSTGAMVSFDAKGLTSRGGPSGPATLITVYSDFDSDVPVRLVGRRPYYPRIPADTTKVVTYRAGKVGDQSTWEPDPTTEIQSTCVERMMVNLRKDCRMMMMTRLQVKKTMRLYCCHHSWTSEPVDAWGLQWMMTWSEEAVCSYRVVPFTSEGKSQTIV